MTSRVDSFLIGGLEHLFSPGGLPLTAKGERVASATSILVRGGAGVGKTTLAIGLAHRIAQHLDGAVLYLGTEFVPTEIKFKGSVLGTDDVLPWARRASAKRGSIVVQHLVAASDVDRSSSGISQKRNAIETAWRLIEQGENRFRAVIVDAFISPEPEEHEAELRGAVLTFVQALEARGVSPVLVQEEAPGLEWLSFLVDVVFGLAFMDDSETGDLLRKVHLTKSRYSLFLPGPHDYGLDMGRPAVWPNSLAVIVANAAAKPAIESACVALPTRDEKVVVFRGGGLVVSDYSTPPVGGVQRVLTAIPGAKQLTVVCGAVTLVFDGPLRVITVPDWEGPFSIAWCILNFMRSLHSNVIYMVGVESIINRKRFAIGLVHLVETLRTCGALVCVHGPAAQLSGRFGPLVSFANSGPSLQGNHLPRNASRLATRWISAPLPIRLRASDEGDAARARELRALVQTAKNEPTTHGALAQLTALTALPVVGPQSCLASLEVVLYLDQLGATDAAIARLNATPFAQFGLNSHVAWVRVHLGDDYLGLRAAHDAIADGTADETMRLLFGALSAILASSEPALQQLRADRVNEPRTIGLLLRALVLANEVEAADGVIESFGERNHLAGWLVARVKAEMRLEAQAVEVRRDGIGRLEGLASAEELPQVHRAEVLFNLALCYEKDGDIAEGRARARAAVDANPELHPARQKLTAWDDPAVAQS